MNPSPGATSRLDTVSAPPPPKPRIRFSPLDLVFGLEEPMPRAAYGVIVLVLAVLAVALRPVHVGLESVDPVERLLEQATNPSRWRFGGPYLIPTLPAATWLLVLFSARRATAARWPAWIAGFVLVPWVQYGAVAALLLLPSRRTRDGLLRIYGPPRHRWALLHAFFFALLLSEWLDFTVGASMTASLCAYGVVFGAVFFGTLRSAERRAHADPILGYGLGFGITAVAVLVAIPIHMLLFVLGYGGIEVFPVAAPIALSVLLFVVRPLVDRWAP